LQLVELAVEGVEVLKLYGNEVVWLLALNYFVIKNIDIYPKIDHYLREVLRVERCEKAHF